MLLDNYKIPGNDLKVRGTLELRTEDIAGETSGSDSVEKGTKPKILNVSVKIPYVMSEDLSDLIAVVQATEGDSRKIYTITDKTANAAGVRQVQFAENFGWQEHDSMRQWDVSFTLREYLSNPERAEKRKESAVPDSSNTEYEKLLGEAEQL
jgi:hypothetical protein